MGNWIPGVDGFAPGEQGTDSGVIGPSGVIPDEVQDPFTGGDAGTYEPLVWASGPVGAILTSDPQGDTGGTSENFGEGIFSGGEQYDPEGWLESSVNFAFDDSNFNPEEDGGDTIDLAGPGAFEFAQDPTASLDPFGENSQFAMIVWALVALGVLYALGPALQAGAEVAA